MPWFNVDDSFYDHPKVFDAPDCAVALWARAGSWSARNLTDGFVPAGMPARLCGDPDAAVRELLDRGLWRRTKGGYLFHDWTDWNQAREAVLRKRAQDAERQRRHRAARSGDSVTGGVTRDSRMSHSVQSNPIQSSVVDLVSHVADRYARDLDDDDLLKTIIDSIHGRTSQVIGADQARAIGASILASARSRPGNLAAYLGKCIRSEPDPAARWLGAPGFSVPPPARPPWCGECDEATRVREKPDGTPFRCPNCHPLREAS